MASKTFSGQLDQAMNEAAAEGNKILFIPQQTVGEVLPGAASELIVESDGSYSITLAYNTYSIYHYSDVTKRKTLLSTDIVVSADTAVSTIPDLIGSTVPVTEDSVLTIQGYLTDAQDSATAAATSESNAAASEAAVTNRVAAYEVESTDYLINTFDGSSLSAGDVVRTLGYYDSGDGGGADWVKTGETGTASQSPATVGDYYINDSIGNEFKLDAANKVELIKLGFGSLTNAENTALVQGLIDNHYQDTSGIEIISPCGEFTFGQSQSSEVYPTDSDGGTRAASIACILLRENCVIRSESKNNTTWLSASPTYTVIYAVDSSYAEIRDITLDGQWSSENDGAGHGIFNVVTDLDNTITSFVVSNVIVKNVGAYGIGVNYGKHSRLLIENIQTFDTGGDGIDLKSFSPDEIVVRRNTVRNFIATRFGGRVTGSVGVDIRGEAVVDGVWAFDFGDGTNTYYGFRMRSAPTDGTYPNNYSSGTTATNIHVIGSDYVGSAGIFVGGNNNSVIGFTIRGCEQGVVSDRTNNCSVSNGVIKGHTLYGIRATSSANNFTAGNIRCVDSVDATAHYRVESDYFTDSGGLVGDSTSTLWSVSASSSSTISRMSSPNDSMPNIDIYGASSSQMRVSVRGASDNIDLLLQPKGTGLLRFGDYTSDATVTADGYILVRAEDGTSIKLLVSTS